MTQLNTHRDSTEEAPDFTHPAEMQVFVRVSELKQPLICAHSAVLGQGCHGATKRSVTAHIISHL